VAAGPAKEELIVSTDNRQTWGASCCASYLELCDTSEHLLETNTDSFNDGKQNRTANGAIPGRLEASTYRQGTSRKETSNCIVKIR
jgi:hypothetical protein